MSPETPTMTLPALPSEVDARARYQGAQQLWVAMGRPDRGELWNQVQRFRAMWLATWRRDYAAS